MLNIGIKFEFFRIAREFKSYFVRITVFESYKHLYTSLRYLQKLYVTENNVTKQNTLENQCIHSKKNKVVKKTLTAMDSCGRLWVFLSKVFFFESFLPLTRTNIKQKFLGRNKYQMKMEGIVNITTQHRLFSLKWKCSNKSLCHLLR